ncbi:hypothetical protein JCM10908_004771 [Rhodotorula pacifica]|uniref:separase n=1 Tax=Rhodotorula pacifica TaxID=1495444 RepID=UPI00317006E1
MKAVNNALGTLSTLNKAGYRVSTASTQSKGSTPATTGGPSSAPRPDSATSRSSSLARAPPSDNASSSATGSSSAAATSSRASAQQRDKVERAAREASKALEELCALVREGVLGGKRVDVEKAAVGIIANLVEMGMYSTALVEIAAARASLLSWWQSTPAPECPPVAAPLSQHASLLQFPLPPLSYLDPPTLAESLNPTTARPSLANFAPLVFTLQQYLLACLFRSSSFDSGERAAKLARVLRQDGRGEGGPLSWRALVEAHAFGEAAGVAAGSSDLADAERRNALRRKVDASLTSMFGSVTKGCAGADGEADPQDLLDVRIHALEIYSTTSTLAPTALDKLSAFFDQVRKTLLLFGRATEKASASPTRISEGVRGAFDRIVEALERRDLLSQEAKGSERWQELCEVVLHIARRADDLDTVERIAQLGGPATSDALGTEPSSDPNAQASQLVAKVANALAVYEIWLKTNEDRSVADQLRRTMSILPVLTRLRCPSSPSQSSDVRLSSKSIVRLDKTLDRLRYVLVKRIKNGQRMDQLVTQAGTGLASLNEVDAIGRTLLDRVMAHVERVLQSVPSGKTRVQLATTAIDSLLVLAHATVVVDDRSTHSQALALLARAQSILRAPTSSTSETTITSSAIDLDLHYSIRAVSSAFYNLGGILYNAGVPENGLAFAQRACNLADAALQAAHAQGLLIPERSELAQSMSALSLSEGEPKLRSKELADELEQRREAMADLDRLMSRRWDLLALTQRALGDKRASYQASLASVLAHPRALFKSIGQAAASEPISSIAQAQPTLYSAIVRLTRLGTFDLLLPSNSLPLSRAARASSLDGSTMGALLEMQTLALQPYIDTEEGRQAAIAVVCEAVEHYNRDSTPIRRARMLVEKLRLAGPSLERNEAEQMLAAVEVLCQQSDLHDDTGLRGFAAQYRAVGHIRMIETLQSTHAAAAGVDEVIPDHAKKALAFLSDVLPPAAHLSQSHLRLSTSSNTSRHSGPHVSPQSPPTATRSRRPARAAATPARARASARRPVPTPREQTTPPKKLATERDLLRESVRGQPGSGLSAQGVVHGAKLLDDPESLSTSLSSLAALLAVKGEVALRLRYLHILQGLSVLPYPDLHRLSADVNIALAREHLALGQLSRAGIALSHVQAAIDNNTITAADIRISYLLSFAEYQAHLGNYERSSQAYDDALSLAETLEADDAASSSTAKILSRTLLLQRASRAADACSTILQRKGELSSCLAPALQSMRLASRAVQNISRISPKPTRRETGAEQVFTAPKTASNAPLADAALVSAQPSRASFVSDRHSLLYWTLAQDLVLQTLRVAHLHFVRGTPKSADFFAQQAYDLAEDLGSAASMAKALVLRAATAQRWGRSESATQHLNQLSEKFLTIEGPVRVAIVHVLAEASLACGQNETAAELFAKAQHALDEFTAAIDPEKSVAAAAASSPQQRRTSGPAVHFAHFTPSPTVGASGSAVAEWVLPGLQSQLIRQRALLHFRQNKMDEGRRLVRRLKRVTSPEEDKAEELKLLAAVQSRDLVARCASDPVLGMLPDSVLSMPALGVSASGPAAKIGTPRTGPSALNAIKDIESLLARALSLGASRSAADKLSELSVVSAVMRAMQANVSKGSRQMATLVAHGLDLGVAVTLRREIMDSITARMARTMRLDDLTWPTPTINTADIAAAPTVVLEERLRDRYRLETAEPVLTEARISEILPTMWSVVTICLSTEKDALLLSRQRNGGEAIVFKLPLDRLSRREGDEDLSLPYSTAMATLREIIERSNAGTQNAKFVDSRDARSAWWQERKELDTQLQALLEGIEDVWLGAFKSVLCDAREHGAEAFASFKARIEKVLKRSMARAAGDRRTARFKVDDAVLQCLAALPATSREEDLEDLFYFMAESFQYSGVPLACDETDVDQVVVDFREALEELHGTKSAPKLRAHPLEHTFLILDKHLHAFPWESIPCLRGRSVSRLPSVSFLRDRLDLASAQGVEDFLDITVNPSRTAYILNPGGDLKNTQQTFEPWLKEQSEKHAWSGVVARVPMEEEVRTALTSRELVLYFGHGGAEQYIRSQTVRNAPQCAVTMLWGCSSGMLKEQGVFDPTGTPYHYMVGGCPALVANLWDVTDKDIDKFAWSVFRRTGIASSEGDSPNSQSSLSLTAAVAQSRDVCNLRYLNGAAPVVYGIPLHFKYSASRPSSPPVVA